MKIEVLVPALVFLVAASVTPILIILGLYFHFKGIKKTWLRWSIYLVFAIDLVLIGIFILTHQQMQSAM